jgi:hypothetical protein
VGYALHAVEDLGAPFLIVHEQIVLIPDSGAQATANAARKLIFLLHGECRHRIEGVPNSAVELRAGDVMVVPHRCRHVYVSPRPGEAWRVQALRLAFDPAVVPPLPLRGAPTAGAPPPEVETDLAAFAAHHFREFRHLPGAQDARVARR